MTLLDAILWPSVKFLEVSLSIFQLFCNASKGALWTIWNGIWPKSVLIKRAFKSFIALMTGLKMKSWLITDSNQSIFQVQVWGKPGREEDNGLLQNRGWNYPSAVKRPGLLEAPSWLLARCLDRPFEREVLTICSSSQDDIGQIEEGATWLLYHRSGQNASGH